MINIRYLGRLRDDLQLANEQIAWQGGTSDDLLVLLRSRGEHWQQALAEQNVFRLAINQLIINDCREIADGDEIAILPPVTGG